MIFEQILWSILGERQVWIACPLRHTLESSLVKACNKGYTANHWTLKTRIDCRKLSAQSTLLMKRISTGTKNSLGVQTSAMKIKVLLAFHPRWSIVSIIGAYNKELSGLRVLEKRQNP